MGLLNNVFMLIESIKDSLDGIKRQANLKGAGIQDTDELAEWATRISTIPAPVIPEVNYDTSGKVLSIYNNDTFHVPAPTVGNTVLIGTRYNKVLTDMYETIEFDDSITSCRMDCERDGSDMADSYIKHLKGDGIRTMTVVAESLASLTHMMQLESLEFPNYTGTFDHSIKRGRAPSATLPLQPNLFIDLRNITIFRPYYSIGRDKAGGFPNGINISGRFDNVETLGGGGYYAEWNYFLVGTLDFPSCTKLEGCGKPAEWSNLTIKLPVVTTFANTFSRGTGEGIMHMYIGPNLATVDSGFWNNLANADIHIPPGDSATKTLLDSHSATYTQDYII